MEKLMRTKKYELFENHIVNRNVQKLRKLLVSMKGNGFDQRFPIAVMRNGSGKYRIMDGHRRFEAAKQLGLDVYYVAGNQEIDLREFAECGEKWMLADYVDSYVREGNKQYIALKDFKDKNKGMPLAVCARLLHGDLAESHYVDQQVKHGTFRVRNIPFAQKVADVIMALKPHIAIASTALFINAVSRVLLVPDIDIERLINNARRLSGEFVSCTKLDEYMDMIENAYNHHMPIRNRVPLRFQADQAARSRSASAKKKTASLQAAA